MSDTVPISQVDFNPDPLKAYPGLNETEVSDRVKRGDINVVVLRSSRTYKDIFKENVLTLFNISFGVVLVVLAALGQVTDAIFSGFTVFSNIVVGVVQEIQAKLMLDKLALLSVQQVTVRRDGVSLIVPLNEVVRDDLIELKPGDRAPVDGGVVFSQMVEMDESLLTGESDPVPKQIDDVVLSGSFCLAGSCVFKAEKIGNESYAVKLSQSSRVYKRVFTPLQKKIDTIVEVLVLGLIVASFLHLASSLNSGLSIVDTLRYYSVIINSFVPAGLVLSISVAFALGAVAISRRRTLIQKINAVDSMNSVRVLCTDKTGTLTQNKLVVQSIIPLGDTEESSLRELIALYTTLMATQNSSARAMAGFVGFPRSQERKADEVAFSSSRKWGAISLELGTTILVGSPEMLLSDPEAQERARQISSEGLRVIAVVTTEKADMGSMLGDGSGKSSSPTLPVNLKDRGLVILEDALRHDVIDTIASLQAKDIVIKVISGDSVETVTSIARQAGILVADGTTYSQKQLEALDAQAFSRAALTGSVFGRITPDTKRRLINAMVKRGAYVAMVGDGVNDVPAFKEAQLAIAMNDGAQISKDVADIVLLDNNLSALPQAFAAGDDIKQKILSSAKLYLTKNIMVILTISFVGFVQLPFPIEPRQMTILTMAVVGVPTILIALGTIKPKRINDFLGDVLGYSFLAGLIGALAMTLGYVLSYFYGSGLAENVDGFPILTSTMFAEIGRGPAQAVSTLIGMFFVLFVFWDVTNISIWKPKTLLKYKSISLLGIGMVLISVVLMLALPNLFQIERPDRLGWTMALFLPTSAHYILRMLQSSHLMRNLSRSLTQP
ncbi:HAD-IC family P-type ATPase [Tumidithrix helvetica PCC 7403]|uniref:HAD-IC family P-type ATPase n=1 Tax=Tumidithrix helvetica TaxID=3457545 RepID=UPI003CAF9620